MEEIKEIVKVFFNYIDEDIRVNFFEKQENSLFVDIKMKEPQVFIGEKGQALFEIENLLKKIVIKNKKEEPIFINLDINDYKKRKADYLRELAIEAAEEVSFTGVEKSFPPMSPFERRIIHITLIDNKDVITESIGEGIERKVLIKKRP